MNVTLTYTELYDTVERSLSVIGKRSTDDNGNRLFADITLGSREVPLIYDYFRQAVIDLATELSAFVTEVKDVQQGESVTLSFPTNHESSLNTFITKSCKAYCVSYALHSWFTVTAPRLSDKYLKDCTRQLAAVIRLSHEKKAPEASATSYEQITGTVTQN